MTLACAEEGLAAVLLYEQGRRDQPLTEALLQARSGAGPSSVRDAADGLLRGHAPWALDLAGAAEALIGAAGDERSQRLFVAWSLQPDGSSQGAIAAREGVSAARVGQIVQSAGRQARGALASCGGPLPWAVRTLRDRLGAVTTDCALAELLACLGASEGPAAGLLSWLAGPYLPVPRRPGWLAVDPRSLAGRTAACLAADGGVCRLADVGTELADAGIRCDQLVAWLSANGAVVVHDLAITVDGQLPDAVERLLDAHGAPRAASELIADLAAGGRVVGEAALAAALRGRRFARTANGGVALAAWGREERRRPAKKRRHHSRGRLARPGRRAADGAPHGQAASVPDRLWLWVKVDAEALRGSEAGVPVALVEGLGLEPPARRTFSSRWGPVTLAHDGDPPTRGSVRAVALAAGARVDDTLLLGFSVRGDVAVELRPASATGDPAGETATGPLFYPQIASGGAP